MAIHTYSNRLRRHARIRAKIEGTQDVPRVSVFRSNGHIAAQIIDDTKGKTLVSASDLKAPAKGTKIERAAMVGSMLAEQAKQVGISRVVFDRGGYRYHGRVKALAESLRQGGLQM